MVVSGRGIEKTDPPVDGARVKRSAVSSSCLRSIGYDWAARILEVEFLDARVYRYFSVPPACYAGLMKAASHGRYYAEHVKGAGFAYEQIV